MDQLANELKWLGRCKVSPGSSFVIHQKFFCSFTSCWLGVHGLQQILRENIHISIVDLHHKSFQNELNKFAPKFAKMPQYQSPVFYGHLASAYVQPYVILSYDAISIIKDQSLGKA